MDRRAHWHPAGRNDWLAVFRKLDLDSTTKLVGYVLVLFADFKTGEHAHPGIANLMAETGIRSNKTVIAALARLRDLGLIDYQFKASREGGRRSWSDEYRLALHDGLRLAAGKEPCPCGTRKTDPWAA